MYSAPNYRDLSSAQIVGCPSKRLVAICLCMLTVILAGPSQADGSVSSTTRTGEWDNTIAVTTLNGRLYSIETSGALYRTDLNTGQWVQVGKAEFANTRFLFSDNQSLFTIETDGSLYRVSPADGSWNRLGQTGAWKNTISLVISNGALYSVESTGALYRTNLSTARWVQLGKAEFGNTRFIYADGQNLYTIEADGSLYRVNPANGSWKLVGTAGEWKGTIGGTTLNGRIYTVEQNGGLYETTPATGTWKQIGKPEFGKTNFMFAANGSLYSLESGDLYRINAMTGDWVAVRK